MLTRTDTITLSILLQDSATLDRFPCGEIDRVLGLLGWAAGEVSPVQYDGPAMAMGPVTKGRDGVWRGQMRGPAPSSGRTVPAGIDSLPREGAAIAAQWAVDYLARRRAQSYSVATVKRIQAAERHDLQCSPRDPATVSTLGAPGRKGLVYTDDGLPPVDGSAISGQGREVRPESIQLQGGRGLPVVRGSVVRAYVGSAGSTMPKGKGKGRRSGNARARAKARGSKGIQKKAISQGI